jgi:hypothetical protein
MGRTVDGLLAQASHVGGFHTCRSNVKRSFMPLVWDTLTRCPMRVKGGYF